MLRNFVTPLDLNRQVSFAILLLRVVFAGFLLTHGYGKLQSFINGDHDFPDPLHVSPVVSQVLTIFAEFFCSILIIFGLLTRPAAVILVVCMAVIAFVVHGPDPIGDKEHGILFLVGFLVILLTGPGRYSVDSRLFR
ncbi:DoxX family protein [Emticicia sp. TH156]|uniref:DoxX family protein n=1 Tax=Emticicia sp. TH156 TaxID=2067454 RepID=UPI000C789323|nr:DoxX family protein [Emticicia sp. TH156]PLK45104.1 DoxX family protein [Emticicia sp. TH156]